jgi:hypothetical protein
MPLTRTLELRNYIVLHAFRPHQCPSWRSAPYSPCWRSPGASRGPQAKPEPQIGPLRLSTKIGTCPSTAEGTVAAVCSWRGNCEPRLRPSGLVVDGGLTAQQLGALTEEVRFATDSQQERADLDPHVWRAEFETAGKGNPRLISDFRSTPVMGCGAATARRNAGGEGGHRIRCRRTLRSPERAGVVIPPDYPPRCANASRGAAPS